MSDLAAVVLLALLGHSLYLEARGLVGTGAAAVVMALVILSHESILRRPYDQSRKARGWVKKWWHRLLHLLLEARRCHSLQLVLVATILSVSAWSAEAVALHWIVQWLGSGLPLAFTAFVYAVSMLAGALSLLLGRLGGAEAVMVSLLVWKGWPAPQAVAATVLYQTGDAMVCCGARHLGTLVGGQGRGAA